MFNIIGINTFEGKPENPINSVVIQVDGVDTLIFIPHDLEPNKVYLSEINTEEGFAKLTEIVNAIINEGV
jgi:hypothetical protein